MKSLVLRVLFCLFALSVPFAQQALGQEIVPLLHCVRYHEGTNTLDAFFGYASSYQTPVHLDVGENNFFSPGFLFRNQPIDFLPGVHENIFVTSYQVSGSQTQITWSLNGRAVTAKADRRFVCDPPEGLGAWNSTVNYGQNVVVSHNGFLWHSEIGPDTPAPGNPPVGLNKEPGVSASTFWALFAQVQGEPGPKGDRGDTGQPGQSVIGQAEPPGSNCTYGGVKYTDINGIRYVCNGAAGLQGPQGPSGNTNAFPSQTYTLSKGCTLVITDSHVTANSVIILQYVGGSDPDPRAIDIRAGRFTVVGTPNRAFRYVVFQ